MSTYLQINYVRGVSIIGILLFFGWFVGMFMGDEVFNWLLLASILSGAVFFVSFIKPDLCRVACLVIGFVLLARAVSLFFADDSFIWVALYGLVGVVSFFIFFKKDDEYVVPVQSSQIPPLQ